MIIIGGVIGAYGAKFLINKDKVILFEEHKPENQPVHCAGLISKTGFEKINIDPSKFIYNKIYGAKFFSKNNLFEIRTKEIKAYVIDRKKFDNFLLQEAIDSGVKFINKRVDDIEINKNFVIKAGNEYFETKNLILASGTNYFLHRKLRKFNVKIPKFLFALQYEIPVECENDMVELHLTKDFFGWVIPVNDFARVGIASYENVKEKLENFIKNLKRKRKVGEILKKQVGLIPIYNPKLKTEFRLKDLNLRLVGDAAAQVKATTGGGIVMGCIAARNLKSKNYENSWRKEIGKELYLHLMIRKFLDKKYEKFDEILEFANKNKEIFYSSDMDFASKLIKNSIYAFLKHPLIITDILKILI